MKHNMCILTCALCDCYSQVLWPLKLERPLASSVGFVNASCLIQIIDSVKTEYDKTEVALVFEINTIC